MRSDEHDPQLGMAWEQEHPDAYVAPVEDPEPVAAAEHLLDQVDALVPDELYDEELDVRVSEYLEDDTCDLDDVIAGDRSRLPLDGESLLDSYAVKAVLGDTDVHGGNLQVTTDGEVYPHDFEMAAWTDLDGAYESVRSVVEMQQVFSASFDTTAMLRMGKGIEGPKLSPTGLRDHIYRVADSVDQEELAEAYRADDRVTFRDDLDAVEEYAPAERIFLNVGEAQDREYGRFAERLYDRVRERF